MSRLKYNERSWAIDLISLINQKIPDLRGPICRAGGEHTLSGEDGRLFPDMLLFGANSSIASWNTLFSDISWLTSIERLLVPASDLFKITRGERRGWDDMFFPPEENPIEECYLKPVLKNLRSTTTYCASPNESAFCCGKSMSELQALGFGRGLGALDLSSTRLRDSLKLLDPDMLSEEEIERIKTVFRPVASREVLPLEQELANEDRKEFDQTVLSAYGIGQHYEKIAGSLRWLHGIRCMPHERE